MEYDKFYLIFGIIQTVLSLFALINNKVDWFVGIIMLILGIFFILRAYHFFKRPL